MDEPTGAEMVEEIAAKLLDALGVGLSPTELWPADEDKQAKVRDLWRKLR